DAADQREFAQDPRLAGRGQRVLEVHRRKRGPDHDLALGQFVQRELLDAAAIAGVVVVDAECGEASGESHLSLRGSGMPDSDCACIVTQRAMRDTACRLDIRRSDRYALLWERLQPRSCSKHSRMLRFQSRLKPLPQALCVRTRSDHGRPDNERVATRYALTASTCDASRPA